MYSSLALHVYVLCPGVLCPGVSKARKTEMALGARTAYSSAFPSTTARKCSRHDQAPPHALCRTLQPLTEPQDQQNQ
jgi:hypothetical protein